MSLDQLIEEASPEWRDEFQTFVETGEATQRFAERMDTDPRCQSLVERAFAVQASDIRAALVRLGGSGKGISAAPPVSVVGSPQAPAATVVTHPSAAEAWYRNWQPYAMVATLVLAVSAGLFVNGFTSIVEDQEQRLAALRRQGAERLELVHSLKEERDHNVQVAAAWQQTANEHASERRDLEHRLSLQGNRLAALNREYLSVKDRLSSEPETVARFEPEARRQPGAPTSISSETGESLLPVAPILGAVSPPALAAMEEATDAVSRGPASTDPADRDTTTLSDAPTVVGPKLVRHGKLRYPKRAAKLGIEGEVVLDCIVTEKGRTEACEIVNSIPELDEAALDLVRKAELEPGRLDGKPQRMPYELRISFKLEPETWDLGSHALASTNQRP